MFTAAIRSAQILSRVRTLLGQIDDTEPSNDLIFALATLKMIEIAEEHLCVEASATIPIVSGTAAYNLTSFDAGVTQSGFFRLKLLAPPIASLVTIEEQDIVDFDFQKRYGRTSTGLPVWYIKIYDDTLTFNPTPGTTESWTIYFFKSPTTTLSKTIGPETPSSFDTAIAYGAASELALRKGNADLSAKLDALYEEKKQKAMEAFIGQSSIPRTIQYYDI